MLRYVVLFCSVFVVMSGCQVGTEPMSKAKSIVVMPPPLSGKTNREVNIGGCVVAFSTAWYAEYGSTAVSLGTLYDLAAEDGHIETNEITKKEFGDALRYFANQDIEGYDIQRVLGGKHLFRVVKAD